MILFITVSERNDFSERSHKKKSKQRFELKSLDKKVRIPETISRGKVVRFWKKKTKVYVGATICNRKKR